MGTDDATSSENLILAELRKQTKLQEKTNILLDVLVSTQSAGDTQTSAAFDPQVMKAMVLLTLRPSTITYGGKIAVKRVAKQVGCNPKKLYGSDVFMSSLEEQEGKRRSMKKGHLNAGIDQRGNPTVDVDGRFEEDWKSIDESLDG